MLPLTIYTLRECKNIMIKIVRIVGEIAVVTATADFHPLRQLKALSTDLKAMSFEGTVLFDLLAVNGLSENRFISLRFDGSQFDRSSFTVESEITPRIKNEQDMNAKEDHSFLLTSVLSSSEIKNFLH